MGIKTIRVTKHPLPMPQAQLVQGDANTQVLRFLVKKDYGGTDLTGLVWSVWVLGEKGEAEVSYIGAGTVAGDDLQIDWNIIPAAAKDPGVTELKLMGSNAGSTDTEYTWVSGKMLVNVAPAQIDPRYDDDEVEEVRQLVTDFGVQAAASKAYVDTAIATETAYVNDQIAENKTYVDTNIAADTAAQKALTARMDTIIPSGTQTEGNTELIDIRTGADNVTYASAGTAVRTQISELKTDLIANHAKEFLNVTTYVSEAYPFVVGNKYLVEILSGNTRLFTRAESTGSDLEGIVSTGMTGYYRTYFEPTVDANFLRISTDTGTSVRISLVGGFYESTASDLENIHSSIDVNKFVVTEAGYLSYRFNIVSGKTYNFRIKSGQLSGIYTRITSGAANLETVCTAVKAPAEVTFAAAKDASWIRVLFDSAGEVDVTEMDGVADKISDIISDIDDVVNITDYVEYNNVSYVSEPYNITAGNSYFVEIMSGRGRVFTRKTADGSAIDSPIPEDKKAYYSILFTATDDASYFRFACDEASTIRISEGTSRYYERRALLGNGLHEDAYAPYPQKPADSSTDADMDSDNITSSDIYNYIDAIADKHPNMITKELLGNDYTDTYPIYRYIVGDKTRSDYLVTVFIGANEHGPTSDPRECAIVVSRFIKDLCGANAKTNKQLNIYKKYFRFVIIPVQNPYGFNNNTRNNGNDVNINRNYNTEGWSVQEDTDKGAYAGSEPETQYIMNTVTSYGCQVALDLHCLGNVKSANDMKCHYEGYYDSSNKLKLIIDSMLRDYELQCSSYGDGDYTKGAEGCRWFHQLGIKGLLLEFQSRDGNTSDADTKLHSANILEADYTFMLRILDMLISDYNEAYAIDKFR